MSQNNIPSNLPTLQKVLQRISSAERTQQKEIRITIQEARELTIELAFLTAKMNQSLQEITDAIKIMSENTQNIDVKFDGGKF